MSVATYKALADCKIGGFFRKAGEVFELAPLEKVPPHLEKVGAEEAGAGKPAEKKTGKPAALPKTAQVTKEDIGAGAARSSADVTSADMIKK